MDRWQIIDAILGERKRQDEKWGVQREHPATLWYTILGEEYGEVGNAILQGDRENFIDEAVQVAAVCLAMLENYEGIEWETTKH